MSKFEIKLPKYAVFADGEWWYDPPYRNRCRLSKGHCNCGKEFLYLRQPSPQKYCSQKCRGKYGIPTMLGKSGPLSPAWKGGRKKNSDGYITLVVTSASKIAKTMAYNVSGSLVVLEHRLVMAEHLGRPILRNETVHHLNGDRADNRLENLQLRNGNHGSGQALHCRTCGSIDIEPSPLGLQLDPKTITFQQV